MTTSCNKSCTCFSVLLEFTGGISSTAAIVARLEAQQIVVSVKRTIHLPCYYHQEGGALGEEEEVEVEEEGQQAQHIHLPSELVHMVVLGPNVGVMPMSWGYHCCYAANECAIMLPAS